MTARIPIPPSEVFEILTDPEQMKCFRSVQAVKQRSLVSDDGRGTQVIHVVQEGKWKFLWLSGSFPVHLRVEQDRRLGRIDFRLLTPGFMQVRCVRFGMVLEQKTPFLNSTSLETSA